MLERVSKLIAEKKPVAFVSYGDSISTVREDYFGGASKPEMNWAFQLARRLEERYPGVAFTARPFGVGGQNAYEGLGRFSWIAPLMGDLVIIGFGTNDSDWHELPPYATAHAVRTLVKGIRNDFKADVVVLAPAGHNPLDPNHGHTQSTHEALVQAAKETGAPLADVRAAILRATDGGRTWKDYHQSEFDCHPNDRGHSVWAKAVFETIEANLR
jgi:lysophospholipase L1-like esterase